MGGAGGGGPGAPRGGGGARGAAPAGFPLPDPDAARVRPTASVRRGTAGPDPAIAPVMPLVLLGQSLTQPLADLLQIELLEDLALLVGQLPARARVQKPLQDFFRDLQRVVGHAAEVVRESAVEGVEVLLAMHAERPGHPVE